MYLCVCVCFVRYMCLCFDLFFRSCVQNRFGFLFRRAVLERWSPYNALRRVVDKVLRLPPPLLLVQYYPGGERGAVHHFFLHPGSTPFLGCSNVYIVRLDSFVLYNRPLTVLTVTVVIVLAGNTHLSHSIFAYNIYYVITRRLSMHISPWK